MQSSHLLAAASRASWAIEDALAVALGMGAAQAAGLAADNNGFTRRRFATRPRDMQLRSF